MLWGMFYKSKQELILRGREIMIRYKTAIFNVYHFKYQ